MQSKQYFTKIKNYPHEKSTEPISRNALRFLIEKLKTFFREVSWFWGIFIGPFFVLTGDYNKLIL